MKQQRLWLAVTLACAGFINQAALALDYRNDDLHYRFSLPSNWVEIPSGIIAEMTRAVEQDGGSKRFRFEAGFQKAHRKPFNFPYMLVQHYSMKNLSVAELAEEMTDLEKEKRFLEMQDRMAISGARIGQPVIDQERKSVALTMGADSPEVGKVRVLTVAFPGTEGVVYLNLYAPQSEYVKYSPAFKTIVDSFAFEEGFGYDPIQAEAETASPDRSGGLSYLWLGAGIAVLLVLLWLARRSTGSG